MTDPYDPPAASLEVPLVGPEQTRARLVGHEARCLALGWLLVGLATLVFLAILSDGLHGVRPWQTTLTYLLVAATPPLVVGAALVRLKSWGRVVAAPLFALALILFPIGTFLGGYALWALFSADGRLVFSREYQEVRERTPEVRPSRTPTLAMLLAVAAIGTAALVI